MAKLLVMGGNGFIGTEVCQVATAAGHEVVGVGRRGRPEVREAWADRVRWVAADVFRPAAWMRHLRGCDAVVHCIGIVRERPERGVTFERVNGDAAVLAAEAAERTGVGAFVFLSAVEKPPLLDPAYLAAKRRAERAVLGCSLRGVVLRPGLVYGRGRIVSAPAAALLRAVGLIPVLGAKARLARPVPVERLARAAVRAALDSRFAGILGPAAIDALGGKERQSGRGPVGVPARDHVRGTME